jgi:hypothetical protein
VGGLVGLNEGTVSNSFWDTQTSGQATSDGGTGKTTESMKNVRTYTDMAWSEGLDSAWDFVGNPYDNAGNEDIWNIDPGVNGGYPSLTELAAPTVTPTTTTTTPTTTTTTTYTTTTTAPSTTTTTTTTTTPPTTTTPTTTPTTTTTAPPTTTTPPAEAPWALAGVGTAIIVIIALAVLVLRRGK